MTLQDSEIGGAYVRRPIYTVDDQGNSITWMRGVHLSAEQILKMPSANRRALISSGALEIHPTPPDGAVADTQLKQENAKLRARVSELEKQLKAKRSATTKRS